MNSSLLWFQPPHIFKDGVCTVVLKSVLRLRRRRAAAHAYGTVPAVLLILAMLVTPSAVAQSIDLTIHDYGLSVGDSRKVNGVRLNFRDRSMERVNGLNLTLWEPIEPVQGDVRGIALGLPTTGTRRLSGIGIGLFGVSAHESIRGIVVGGIGAGSGRDVTGVGIGLLGVGSGRDLAGVMVGGLGAGSGRDVSGIAVGGLGVGGGRNVRGLMIGGFGAGSGGNISGIGIGGFGIGAGGDATGLLIGGIGVGAGADVTGIIVGGIGVGAGGTIRGIAVAGGGVGAPSMRGLIVSGVAAGGEDIVGAVIAPAYFRVVENGRFRGASISAFNYVDGEQHGLTIGILNIARRLNGVQIGLINYAKNNPRGLKLLPILNLHLD